MYVDGELRLKNAKAELSKLKPMAWNPKFHALKESVKIEIRSLE